MTCTREFLKLFISRLSKSPKPTLITQFWKNAKFVLRAANSLKHCQLGWKRLAAERSQLRQNEKKIIGSYILRPIKFLKILTSFEASFTLRLMRLVTQWALKRSCMVCTHACLPPSLYTFSQECAYIVNSTTECMARVVQQRRRPLMVFILDWHSMSNQYEKERGSNEETKRLKYDVRRTVVLASVFS